LPSGPFSARVQPGPIGCGATTGREIVVAGAVAVGSVSGAAFNPAVAFALTVAGLLQWKWIWLYLLAQFVGAALAGLAFRMVEPDDAGAADEPEDELRWNSDRRPPRRRH